MFGTIQSPGTPERRVANVDHIGYLTPSEKKVARLIPLGLTNQEIADQTFTTVSTVKKHVKAVQLKLRKRNRVEVAVAVALATFAK